MNRKTFFDAIRPLFGGKLSAAQVAGTEAILDAWGDADPRWMAYALATAKWETAHTMQPIKERGGSTYFKRMYDRAGERPHVAKQLGNTEAGDGARYCGRGYVQLTGRANYRRMGELLGVEFENDPDLALNPKHAAAIMCEGMTKGLFTGKKLADYFNASKDDPRNARRIINGTDHAAEIAETHRKFLAALKAAGPVVVAIPPPPDIEPTAPRPPTSWWHRLNPWKD